MINITVHYTNGNTLTHKAYWIHSDEKGHTLGIKTSCGIVYLLYIHRENVKSIDIEQED